MLKELAVNFQQIWVRTEDILQFSELFLFLLKQGSDELFQSGSFLQGNRLNKMELYSGVNNWHFQKS